MEPTVELRFRLDDSTDICSGTYPTNTTFMSLRERLLAEWPKDREVVPKSVAEIRLIHAGRIMEQRRLCDSKSLFRHHQTGEVLTLLAVVQSGRDRIPDVDEGMACSCCSIL